jgi:hypothetical protein
LLGIQAGGGEQVVNLVEVVGAVEEDVVVSSSGRGGEDEHLMGVLGIDAHLFQGVLDLTAVF